MGLSPDTLLGRYQIQSRIAMGGMGEVYLAKDTVLERRIALKVLPAEVASDQQRMARFQREAKATSGLNHPNIITIHEIGQAGTTHFIAEEYVEGETLRAHLRRGRMPLEEVLDVGIQVAAALVAAHEAGVLHRDIKPENVMLRQDGYVKVLDFGLAKLNEKQPRHPREAAEWDTRTEPGVVMGTVDYMSPEQASGLSDVDERTDIWSLGVLLYEMIAGRVPFGFDGATPTAVMAQIIHAQAPPLQAALPETPDELNRIVMKALENKRDYRYQSAKEMLVDLKRFKRRLERESEGEHLTIPDWAGATAAARVHPASQSRERSAFRGATGPVPSAPALPSQDRKPSTQPPGENWIDSRALRTGELRGYRRSAVVALIVLAIGLAGAWIYWHWASGHESIDSVAVLPFENESRDPNTEYLSDGITESIINSLTQLPQLRVIARSSVFRYKGKDTDPVKAANDLGVRAVVTGRVMQRGDNLTVSTELVDVKDDKQLWGEQYERNVSDLMTVQREIAREISSNLRLKLSGSDQTRVMRHYTDNPEAYELYLKGRFYWNKRTAESLRTSIDYFNQAVAQDPSYALAYAGLSDSWALLSVYADLPLDQVFPKARAAAYKALELDDSLAEAHNSVANAKYYEWKFRDAEKEFKRAIELNPSYATARQWYAEMLSALGRHTEAIAEIKRAEEVDPLSVIVTCAAGTIHNQAGQYDEGLSALRKAVAMDPNFPRAHQEMVFSFEGKKNFEEAISEQQKADVLSGRETPENAARRAQVLRAGYRKAGEKGYWQACLELLQQDLNRRYVPSFAFASVYGHLGNKEKAFEWLEKSYEEHGEEMIFLTIHRELDFLHSDPRYAELLRKVGLTGDQSRTL